MFNTTALKEKGQVGVLMAIVLCEIFQHGGSLCETAMSWYLSADNWFLMRSLLFLLANQRNALSRSMLALTPWRPSYWRFRLGSFSARNYSIPIANRNAVVPVRCTIYFVFANFNRRTSTSRNQMKMTRRRGRGIEKGRSWRRSRRNWRRVAKIDGLIVGASFQRTFNNLRSIPSSQ